MYSRFFMIPVILHKSVTAVFSRMEGSFSRMAESDGKALT